MPSDPVGAARRMLESDPKSVEHRARRILDESPDNIDATLLLAQALRRQHNRPDALTILEALGARESVSALVYFELGLALRETGEHQKAIAALNRAVDLDSSLSDAWHALGEEYLEVGDIVAADRAFAHHQNLEIEDPRLQRAVTAFRNGFSGVAEDLVLEFLETDPDNEDAIRILAEVALAEDRHEDAAALLSRCLEISPGSIGARHRYASLLALINRPHQALPEIEEVLKHDPRNPQLRSVKGTILAQLGRPVESLACFEAVVQQYPKNYVAWTQYAQSLRNVGRQDEAIAAYRKSIALIPNLGTTYWSLANLKTFRFTDADIEAMLGHLANDNLPVNSRLHFLYSLGKAYEDLKEFGKSFDHYQKGAALQRSTMNYDGESVARIVPVHKELFDREFFAKREGWGWRARDPIFIVGLPRAGSTLLEQILSSHSMVEGTMELAELSNLGASINRDNVSTEELGYPENLQHLSASDCERLGRNYLENTRVQRHLERPFFTDKMPSNFLHLPFIHLILPNAKVIDARRHPLACCFSNFKQLYSRGQFFSYSLTDLGSYYRAYVELMAYYDDVLPGTVHRVIYEEMVGNPEREIRRLLGYLGLPFEESCLRFHETERSVRTSSSEQVRQPLYTSAKEHWRNFEPWLGPLKDALGPVLDAYPDVPKFDGPDLPRSG